VYQQVGLNSFLTFINAQMLAQPTQWQLFAQLAEQSIWVTATLIHPLAKTSSINNHNPRTTSEQSMKITTTLLTSSPKTNSMNKHNVNFSANKISARVVGGKRVKTTTQPKRGAASWAPANPTIINALGGMTTTEDAIDRIKAEQVGLLTSPLVPF
jgi:hypothetical protein